MMFVMLVAGIGLVLAGLLATGYGISIKEFSTGNTLIITGVMAVCTGVMMLALWMAVRELKTIARRLGTGVPEARGEARGEAMARPVLPVAATRDSAPSMAASRPPSSPAVPDPFLQRHRRLSLQHRRRGRTRLSCVIIRFRNRCTPNRHRRLRNRSAICCFHRRREKSASAPRRGLASRCRRTCCRRTFAPGRPLCRRSKRPNHSRHRLTMPGRERNAQDPVKFCRSGAAAACPRRSQKPTVDRRTLRISRR